MDPENPDNTLHTLQGQIRRQSYPNTPLQNVNVSWENDGRLVKTGTDGRYLINDILPYDGWLQFNLEGYFPESLEVKWNGSKIKTYDEQLNSIPFADSVEFYSSVEKGFGTPDDEAITVKVKITDRDGPSDIDTLWLSNESINLRSRIGYNPDIEFFQRNFTAEMLNVLSLGELIGRDFSLDIKDYDGRLCNVGTLTIKRVIKSEITPERPIEETVNVPFNIEWERFEPGFEIEYYLEIFPDNTDTDPVYTSPYVPSDSTNFRVSYTIPQGSYYWVIWGVDEFGNRTRSRESKFNVE